MPSGCRPALEVHSEPREGSSGHRSAQDSAQQAPACIHILILQHSLDTKDKEGEESPEAACTIACPGKRLQV